MADAPVGRLWGGNSDSDSDSDSSNSSGSDSEPERVQQQRRPGGGRQWAELEDSSSDEDDEKRVVVKREEKRFAQLRKFTLDMAKKQKIQDFASGTRHRLIPAFQIVRQCRVLQ